MDESELNEIVKLSGGPNFDPYKKQRKAAEKLRRATDAGINPFRIAKASAKQTSKQTQQPLYGDLWRAGELAVLTGESGVGKSLLATQIAEVIARGAQDSINGLPTDSKPLRVIYFDFERTPEQFSRLYSCRPYPNQKYVEEYKFSGRFRLARLDICTDIPDAFNGSPDRYIRHWVFDTIAEGEADVFIIDNIAHLSVGTTVEKVMRALRTAASMSGASLLVIANAKPKRRPSEITIADLTRCRSLREIPDTIFALSRSTLHPDIRYVKDLKARTTQLTADLPATLHSALLPDDELRPSGSAVLSYQIDRVRSPLTLDDTTGGSQSTSLQNSSNYPLSNIHYPFLGLRYLGLALESKHLPAPRVSSRVSSRVGSPHVSKGSRRPLSARSALVNGMIDGSYGKYLLGE